MTYVCSPAPPTLGLCLAQAQRLPDQSASGIVPSPASLAPSLPEIGYAWGKELPSPLGTPSGVPDFGPGLPGLGVPVPPSLGANSAVATTVP